MPWPLSQDYNEAIQDPTSAFGDAELQGGKLKLNTLGLPLPCSGNFADVYEVTCPATQSKWAVKCFTRQVSGLRERYTAISKHLKDANLPFTVDFQFLERGIRIRSDWFPVLKMRWVEGLLLNEFVRDNLDKPPLMQALGQIWLRMARRLREANIAHADLQHGNVLLVPGSTANSLAIKLIDYDGMWVPALARSKSGEVGHPNYQHPQRLKEETYDAEVDRFPLLVVATALRGVSIGGRSLWGRYDNGDNLLFKETDILAPDASPVFRELGAASDPLLRKLVGQLRQACRARLRDTPLLDELVSEEKPTAVPPKLPTPMVVATAAANAWDFEPDPRRQNTRPGDNVGKNRRDGERQALPAWAWWVGGVGLTALLAVSTLAVVLLMRGNSDTRPGPIAQNSTHPTNGVSPFPPRSTRPLPPPTAPPATRPAPARLQPFTNSVDMEFVWIKPGSFQMGSPKTEHRHDKDEVQHRVTLTRGLWMQTTLVTQAQWKAVMGEDNNPSNFQGDDLPVNNVSWKDAKEFCTNLNEKEKREPEDQKYRLPYEAEWEYAARAGTKTPFWQGETITPDDANFAGNSAYRDTDPKGKNRKTTTSVKKFRANPWGLYDMAGNLCQWCEDRYGDYPEEDIEDSEGPENGERRVLRGGSWFYAARDCRVAHRVSDDPGSRDDFSGFRLVLPASARTP